MNGGAVSVVTFDVAAAETMARGAATVTASAVARSCRRPQALVTRNIATPSPERYERPPSRQRERTSLNWQNTVNRRRAPHALDVAKNRCAGPDRTRGAQGSRANPGRHTIRASPPQRPRSPLAAPPTCVLQPSTTASVADVRCDGHANCPYLRYITASLATGHCSALP